MANTPMTRPPGHPRHLRTRPPRGRRPVARRDDQIRQQLANAASHLNSAGKPELADAIDLALAPGGWRILRRTDPGEPLLTLPIRISATDRDRIRAAQEKTGSTLTGDADEALAAFVDGTFSPEQEARSVRGSQVQKVVMSVRPDPELYRRAEQAAVERAEELGWKPVPMQVIRAWLIEKYPAPKASRK